MIINSTFFSIASMFTKIREWAMIYLPLSDELSNMLIYFYAGEPGSS